MASNIHEAINEVMQKVGYVQKQSAPNLRYTFAGEAALIAALRPAMLESEITMHVSSIDDVATREYHTDKGTSMVNVSLSAQICFTHAPSQTAILVMARGEGADSGDKANNKAMTCAFKYALRQTFMIETGDDPDSTSSDELQKAPTREELPEPPETINPDILVACGLSENVFEGKNIINNLGIAGKSKIVGLKKAYLYRSWRATLEPQEAASKTIANLLPDGFDQEAAADFIKENK